MKKYRLLAAEEWAKDKIETPLDASIYNILTEDLPESEKLGKYSEAIGEFSNSAKTRGDSVITPVPPLTISIPSPILDNTNSVTKTPVYQSQGILFPSNLQGQGTTIEVESEKTPPLDLSESFSPPQEEASDVGVIVPPPGIQTRDWRALWITLKKH